MTQGDLEHAVKLSRSDGGVWTAHSDPNYESMNGMFGGWTAAVALRAVCDEADSAAAPSALTVNFVDKVEPGSDLLIRTRRVGGGRSVSHWQSELTVDEARWQPHPWSSPSVATPMGTWRSRCPTPQIPPCLKRCTLHLGRVASEPSCTQFSGLLHTTGEHVLDLLGSRDQWSSGRSSSARVPRRSPGSTVVLLERWPSTKFHDHARGLLPRHRRRTS